MLAPGGAVFVAPLIALVAGTLSGPQPSDDAFITLRYARSLAAGEGFVFNPGERVLGTTTPLFALTLAALHLLTAVDFVWLAFWLALGAHIWVTGLMTRIGMRCELTLVACTAAVLYALAPIAFAPTAACMETALFVALTLSVLAPVVFSERLWWPHVAAALAILLRPEGVLVAAVHVARVARVSKRAALQAAGTVSAVILPWIAFAAWYFRNPVPQSLLVKWGGRWVFVRVAESLMNVVVALPLALPMARVETFELLPFGSTVAKELPGCFAVGTRRLAVLVIGAACVIVVAAGAVRMMRRNSSMRWLFLFVVVYAGAYGIARPAIFPWYLVPLLPALLLAFVSGCTAVIDRLVPSPVWAWRVSAGGAVCLIACAVMQYRALLHSFPDGREVGYRRAVQLLGAAAQDPTISIGALEIGAIGYYSHARIIDHFGLVTPDAVRLGTMATVNRYKPDYYIGQRLLFYMLGFYATPEFGEEYELTTRVPGSRPGAAQTFVYARRVPPHAADAATTAPKSAPMP